MNKKQLNGLGLLFLQALGWFILFSSSAYAYQRSYLNLGFESPVISTTNPPPACRVYISSTRVPGWLTTHPYANEETSGTCSVSAAGGGQIIELWKGPRGIGGDNNATTNRIAAREGSQFAELNAAQLSELQQNICLINGETVGWRFSHNGRNPTNDTIVFRTGTQRIATASTSMTGDGTVSECSSGTCNVSSRVMTTDGVNRWADYSGSFTYNGNSGQTVIGFQSTSGSSTNGNFLDAVQITVKPIVEFTSASYSVPENGGSSQPIQVVVAGIVPGGGLSLTFNVSDVTTTLGADYTINGGTANTFSITVPAGDYGQGTPLRINVPVTIINDNVHEDDEVFKVTLQPNPAYHLMSTSACGATGYGEATYTIIDDDQPVDMDLSIVKSQRSGTSGTFQTAPLALATGNTVQYRLVVTNKGTNTVSTTARASFMDVIPGNITGLSIVGNPASGGGATSCSASFTGNTLNGLFSGPTNATCTVTVQGTANTGGIITNTATVTVPSGNNEIYPSDNTSSVQATIARATLILNKITSGGIGTFNYTLTNTSQTSGTVSTSIANQPSQVDGDTTADGVQAFAILNNANVLITENTLPATWQLSGVSCVNRAGASVGSRSGATYTIPSSAITVGEVFTCNFLNTKTSTLTLQKVSQGGTGTFNFSHTNLSSATSSISTTSAGIAAPVNPATFIVTNTANDVTIRETLPAGGGYSVKGASCTDSNAALTGNLGSFGNFNPSTNTLTIPYSYLVLGGAELNCTFINSKPSLTIRKISQGGTGTFSFSGTNGIGSQTITTTAPDTIVTGTTQYLSSAGIATEITETVPAGYTLSSATCSGMGPGGTATLQGNKLTLNAAATAVGSDITCTFTNTATGTDLAIEKTGASSVTQGNSVSYTIKVWNKGPVAASSSLFTDAVPAGLTDVSWICSASGSAVCGTASGSGNNISVNTGALPVNNSATAPTAGSYLTFSITGTASTAGTLSNTASIAVTSGIDPVSSNNSSTASTIINPPAALVADPVPKEARFSISPNLPTIYRGQSGIQLVAIRNLGPDDASGTVAIFRPHIQTGVTVLGVKVAGGADCSLVSGEWSCPVGSVTNGASFQLEVNYDTTSSAALGTAIQADIRVNSNEFNPGSGVGETLYKVWGSNQANEIRPNGAFWAGFRGAQGTNPGSGYDDETTPIINAWPVNQSSPTGSYLVTAVPGTNNNVYAASSTNAPPIINRIITNMSTDPDRSVILPALDSSSAADNRRAWEFRTGIFVPQATNVTFCIGNTSVGIDDGAYIMLDGTRIGTQDSYAPNGYVSATVSLTPGYHTLSYRILNQNTHNGSAEVAQGLYGAIGILYNGTCDVAGYDAWVNSRIPASINIVEQPTVTISGQVFEDNSGSTAVNSNAYNGIRDTGENGIAGSQVSITNCNTGIIATTTTNANGEYRFSLSPADLPAGSFCIAQTNLTGYSSVSGTTGYNRSTDTITVSNTGASSYSNHHFGDARLTAVLSEDGQQTIAAGGVADYPHRLTARTVLTISSLNHTTLQQPAHSDQNWQAVIYRDDNCNGRVDHGENLFSQSLPLTLKNAEEICLVQRVYAPVSASMGAQHIGQLSASFSVTLADNSQIAGVTLQRQDTTLLGSSSLGMQKGVRRVATCPSTAADTASFTVQNQAQGGDYLEYEITYRNNSTKNLTNVSIKDSVPPGTVYRTAACVHNPSGSCHASHTNGALLWQNNGTLLPNQQGKVRFCVQVP